MLLIEGLAVWVKRFNKVITDPLKYFMLDRGSKLFPANMMCQEVELVKDRNVI